MHKKYAILATC
jgi:NAD+ synthase (glutamine-hydrolysing)